MHPIIELRNVTDLEKSIINALMKIKRPSSQGNILKHLDDAPSQPTVSRAMKALIEKGILRKDGATRGAKYSLTPEALHFATHPDLRVPISYDPARINNYVPNETKWLPAEYHEQMTQAATGVVHGLDASTYSVQIAEHFMIDLSWASSNLEGNTYDYLSTEVLLKYGKEATGKQREETAMILNHKAAITHVLEHLAKGMPDSRGVRRIHALMMRDLLEPSKLGEIRSDGVRIGSSCYRPSASQKDLSYDQQILLAKAAEIADPFEASFFLLTATSYLQAFWDGNKRMGRLLSSVPLLLAGHPPHSFVEIDQQEYISGLILFYEAGDTEILARSISEAYVKSAPAYQAAVSIRRVPSSIELTERAGIAETVKQVIEQDLDTSDVPTLAAKIFTHLNDEDLNKVTEITVDALRQITPVQAVIYDISEEEIERWLDGQNSDDNEASIRHMPPTRQQR